METTNTGFKYRVTKSGWVLIFSAVIIIGLLIYLAIQNFGNAGGLSKNKASWQAIFLTNNQTYFGQVISENSDSVVIKNIYYLQDMVNLHQGAEQIPKDFPLIKLGNEVHGPYDEMRINRQHILFVEDLTDDAKIVEAINKYENTKK